MIQTQENGEKPYFCPDLGPLDPNLGWRFFFSKFWHRQSLDILITLVSGQMDGQTDRQTDREWKVIS